MISQLPIDAVLVSKAAKTAKVSRQRIYAKIKEGRIKAYDNTGVVLVSLADVLRSQEAPRKPGRPRKTQVLFFSSHVDAESYDSERRRNMSAIQLLEELEQIRRRNHETKETKEPGNQSRFSRVYKFIKQV